MILTFFLQVWVTFGGVGEVEIVCGQLFSVLLSKSAARCCLGDR